MQGLKSLAPLSMTQCSISTLIFYSQLLIWTTFNPFNGNFIFLPISSVLVFIEMMVGARGGNMGAVNVE